MLIWEFTDYRQYLLARLGREGSRSGSRKELASAINVHTTYVSQVMKAKAELSLEQAEAINSYFAHTEDEGEYFILLVLKDRAGTIILKRRFETKIQKMREVRLNIAKRLQTENKISEVDREKFYSSAYYGLVHVLSSLPHLNNVEALAGAIQLPKAKVAEIVEFLVRIGLVVNNDGKLSPGNKHVHLANDSELILKHHTNWRLHAISKLQFIDRDDLHYSAALSISHEDAFRVKEAILETLKRTVTIVRETEVQTAYTLNFDFYKLI